MKRLLGCALLGLLSNGAAAGGNSWNITGTPLDTMPWEVCTGYAGCGQFEFCVIETTQLAWTKYGFRLPGKECIPGKGPVIRMEAGKKYQITLKNTGLPGIRRHKTSVHFHGLHIAVGGRSDDLTRVVEAGNCVTYVLNIPANHMGGTHWYYPADIPNTQVQIHGGAFGMVIIEDKTSGVARVDQWMMQRDHELLLIAAKMEVQTVFARFHNIWVGNGGSRAPLVMSADRWYRLRVVGMEHAGRPGYLTFSVPSGECQILQVAVDGVWTTNIPNNMSSQLSHEMISRRDFAVKCTKPGQYDVSFFGGVVAVLQVGASAPTTASPYKKDGAQWKSTRPDYLTDLRAITPTQRQSFYIVDGYMNSKEWNPLVPLYTIPANSVVEWTLKSTGSGPFHIQGYHMQVVSDGCGWHKRGEWYDVISAVPADAGEMIAEDVGMLPVAEPDCIVRLKLVGVVGKLVARCHYHELSDAGSQGWLNVTGAGLIPDTKDVTQMRCDGNDICVLDGSCTPVYECDSYVGRDNCGGPCMLSASQVPQCPVDKPVCDTVLNTCMLAPLVKPRNSNPAARGTAAPTSLLTVQWKSALEPGGCPLDFDYCADFEFCQIDDIQFAYRLPGYPCVPHHCPVIRMQPGKKYIMALHNMARLDSQWNKGNMHTHGIHIPGDGNTDDVTRESHPGQTLFYNWSIPSSHLGGTFWYHAHPHRMTHRQVAGGAVGMLIIEDPKFFVDKLPDTFRLFLQNEMLLIAARVGELHLGNGNALEPLRFPMGQWMRLRMVGVDPEATAKDVIFPPQCDIHRMQYDGVWSNEIPANIASKNQWTISGATRMELAVRCNQAGTFPVWFFGGVAAQFIVGAGPVLNDASPWILPGQRWSTAPLRPVYLQDLRPMRQTSEPVHKTTFVIKHGYINDITFNVAVPLLTETYNTLQEWTITGTALHIFHLHIWHMQIIKPGGCGFQEEGEWYDVIANSDTGDCTVQFKLYDYTGRTIFHCHYLEHEDLGTMGWMNVTGDGPQVNYWKYDAQPTTTDLYLRQIPSGSINTQVALLAGSNVVGTITVDMTGQILAVTTAGAMGWMISNLWVYIGTNPVPVTAAGDANLVGFPFTRLLTAVKAWTFSGSLARFGIMCPSTAALNIAVVADLKSLDGTSKITVWGSGQALGARGSVFQFTPSCEAPVQPGIFLREGLISRGLTYTIQLARSSVSIPAASISTLPKYALVLYGTTLTCPEIFPLATATAILSEDGKGWVLNQPTSIAGWYNIYLVWGSTASTAQCVAYPTQLGISGVISMNSAEEECHGLQEVSSDDKLPIAIDGVNLSPSDLWWLIPHEENCTAPHASSNRAHPSGQKGVTVAADVHGLFGQLALCYLHNGEVSRLPTCVRVMSSASAASTSSTDWVIWVGVGIGGVLLGAALMGCWAFRRVRKSSHDEMLVIEDTFEKVMPRLEPSSWGTLGRSPGAAYERLQNDFPNMPTASHSISGIAPSRTPPHSVSGVTSSSTPPSTVV